MTPFEQMRHDLTVERFATPTPPPPRRRPLGAIALAELLTELSSAESEDEVA